MNKIAGLPDTAQIEVNGCDDLIITNHRVTSPDCLFKWLLLVMVEKQWDCAVSQMISQGFKLDGIKEQCILDLQDEESFDDILVMYEGYILHALRRTTKKSPDIPRKIITGKIIKKIQKCKNWKQFHNNMRLESSFQRIIRARVMRGRGYC